MTARDTEAALLTRCAQVAQSKGLFAQNQVEANVFRLAAMVLQPQFPAAAAQLRNASNRYFGIRPNEKLPPAEVINRGWVIGLPRLRDMLSHQLRRH
jgi:hypothetical protein